MTWNVQTRAVGKILLTCCFWFFFEILRIQGLRIFFSIREEPQAHSCTKLWNYLSCKPSSVASKVRTAQGRYFWSVEIISHVLTWRISIIGSKNKMASVTRRFILEKKR